MGKIVATEYVSLDGVVEAPGGGEEFEHAGWTFEIERGEKRETMIKTNPVAELDSRFSGDWATRKTRAS